MCDVLLIGEAIITKAWFGDSVEALPKKWVQATTFDEGISYLKVGKPKLILVGDSLLKRDFQNLMHIVDSGARVLVISDCFEAERFQQALDLGAEDFWVMPVNIRHIHDKLKKTRTEIQAWQPEILDKGKPSDEMIIGASQDMIMALRMASLMAKTDTTVLIRGESGTGKELLAREIHRLSGRFGPFVALNCAAVSEGVAESELFGHERGSFTGAVSQRQGCFEQANKGTLFLDEVGDASAAFQAKLLRVLERNEFTRVGGQQLVHSDVRVIAATNCDIESQIGTGHFRLDLHYRLGAVTIGLPPLRERREDLPEIISKMVGKLNGQLRRSVKGVSRGAVEQMLAYDWPGNLRELYHVLHRGVLLCRQEVVDVEHLQGVGEGNVQGDLVHIPTLSELEETHIAQVLDITAGNRGRACDLLGISRPTLRRKLRQYALELEAVPA
ncbi:MAG: DNA-binding NtrC family response regulator [Candidatus Latescibacterota bacterium]|jgi:DNA-binding NtrC family response regulator